ncbi:MAG: hypothetical protein GXO36_02050 [Chloroflexi bacterium]|nr:hypothetical protein [Chloroflexota bacterium]
MSEETPQAAATPTPEETGQEDMLPLPPEELAPTEPPKPYEDRGMQAVEPVGWDASTGLAEAFSLVTLERIRALWRQADALQRRVLREVHDKKLATELLDKILEARNALSESFENYEEAERLLNEVAFLLEYQKRVREWSYSTGLLIFFYEVTWMTILGVALIFLGPGLVEAWATRLGYSPDAPGMNNLTWFVLGVRSAIWGGLGGATGALYALWRHVAVYRDFDQDHLLWYLVSPLQGMALGAFAFAAVMAGLLSMLPGEEINIRSAMAIFAMAWVMGFQQNVVYNIVRRVLKAVGLGETSDTSSPMAEVG